MSSKDKLFEIRGQITFGNHSTQISANTLFEIRGQLTFGNHSILISIEATDTC